jgi:hypothetical protein
MKRVESADLQEPEQPISAVVKRAVRRPKKPALAQDQLRGWAKSAIKGRNKT